MNSDGVLQITSKEQYKRYLADYNCKNLDQFIETMWYNYGVDVEIDKKLEDTIRFHEKNGIV